MIVNGAGDPILMGWLAPGSTTINAATTAQVLLYFATNCFTLTDDVRTQAIALIPNLPGLANVTAAVSAALVANSDPFVGGNASVESALTALIASFGSGPAAQGALRFRQAVIASRRPSDVAISPLNGTTGSGIAISNDFPDGIHFVNSFRRRAEAFIDRTTFVDANGNLQQSPAALLASPAPIPPVAGTNGGVISTFVDIFNGNYAFSPVSTPSIPLPLVPNSKKTTYILTIVGAGVLDGAFDTISAADQAASNSVAETYMVQDLLVPFIVNVVLPANSSAIDEALATEGGTAAVQDFIQVLDQNVPAILADEAAGNNTQALTDALNAVTTANVTSAAMQQLILNLVISKQGINAQVTTFEAFSKWNGILQTVTYGLSAFDTTVVGTELAQSDRADQFQIDVIPDTVTLLPQTSTVEDGASQTLTANVLADTTSDNVPLSFTWTDTAKFGHITDGKPGHTDNFTSTSNTVTYTANAAGSGTDTITMQAATIQSPGQPSSAVGNLLSATVNVTVPTVPTITLSPSSCVQFGFGGGTQTYTVNVSNAPPLLTLEFGFLLEAPTASQTLTDPGATKNTFSGQLVGPSNSATLTIGPEPSPQPGTGFNGTIFAQLWSVGSNGQLSNIFGADKAITATAQYGFGDVDCAGNITDARRRSYKM